METTRQLLRMIAALALCLAVGMLAACSGGPPSDPVAPGVTSGLLGGMEVVGYLAAPDTEGGPWTVFDSSPSTSSVVQPKALATLKPGSVDQAGIAALDGRYIWAAGRGSSGAIPEIQVDGIQPAEVKR